MIIALGESIVSIGIGATGVSLTAELVTAAVLAILSLAALWWAYFDVYAVGGQRRSPSQTGVVRARIARDFYSYLHLPMIAGIVLFALGLKKTVEHVGDPLETVPAVALCGGLALYYFSHVSSASRSSPSSAGRRGFDPITGEERPSLLGRGRPAAFVVLLALIPVVQEVSALDVARTRDRRVLRASSSTTSSTTARSGRGCGRSASGRRSRRSAPGRRRACAPRACPRR